MTRKLLGWLGRRMRPARGRPRWPLGLELLRWTPDEPFTLEDACKGLQIWGMTGSGKSSGSGKLVALSYLRAGFGGLVLVAKPSETQTWCDYVRAAGREADLVVFSPSAPWRYNFLDHELRRPGAGVGLTENLLQLFVTVAEVAGRGAGGRGRDDEGYWQRALQQLLRNAIDLLVAATGRVSVPDLYRLVVSAPTGFDQVASAAWQSRSFCWECLQKGDAAPKDGYRGHDFAVAADYFLAEYPGLSDKTRSVVVSSFTSMADALNRGVLRELFGTATNVTPDDCLDGKILVVDLNVKEYDAVGRYAAAIWKAQFQRAVERRAAGEADPRPCFLFADESQLFTAKQDALFQTTARSARCCTVYLTQNLSNYLSAYAGEGGEADARSLLGNLTTHVVHALGDSGTAEFVADLIGRSKQWFSNGSVTHQPYHPFDGLWGGGGGGGGQSSGGFSESFEYEVQPAELGRMATGGAECGYRVGALVWRGGRPFRSTGKSYVWTSFNQRET